MAEIAGYKGKLEVSSDGLATWSDVCGIIEGGFETSPETEDVTNWCDNGEKRERTTVVGTTMTFNGYRQTSDPGQQKLEAAHYVAGSARSTVHCRYYPDKSDLTAYYEFTGNVSNFTKGSPVAGFQTYDCSVGASQVKPFNIFKAI